MAEVAGVNMNGPKGLAALAIAACVAAACSAAGPYRRPAQSHRSPVAATIGQASSPLTRGSAASPVVFTCDQTSNPPASPGPGDVVVGPLWIISARDSVDPNGAGPHPPHEYKYPIAVRPGATVTMMIAPPARGHVVIDNPHGPFGVIAATYQACSPSSSLGWSVFVQGFAFTDGQTRGCVPLTVQAGPRAPIRHVTISLYAGHCTV